MPICSVWGSHGWPREIQEGEIWRNDNVVTLLYSIVGRAALSKDNLGNRGNWQQSEVIKSDAGEETSLTRSDTTVDHSPQRRRRRIITSFLPRRGIRIFCARDPEEINLPAADRKGFAFPHNRVLLLPVPVSPNRACKHWTVIQSDRNGSNLD